MGRSRAAFLDRDGVINAMWWDPEHGTMDAPANPGQFRLLPGAGTAIQLLRDMGFLVVVASNQPGVAKGKMVPELLEVITQKMNRDLAAIGARVDVVYYCLHHPEAVIDEYRVVCDCRKPKPGLLRRAAGEFDIDLADSYMIGDGTVDVQAGRTAGCRTIWLGSVKCDQCQILHGEDARPDFIAENLLAAARLIRMQEGRGGNIS
ncbi:MAG: HAD family hydrolase [Acidobacteria bacterium]|nr:HAD family hydrolase [Acidobacteriota bacterium]